MSLDALEAVLRARASGEFEAKWEIRCNHETVVVTAETCDDAETADGGFALATVLLDELLAAGYVAGWNLKVAAVVRRSDITSSPRWRGRLDVALVPQP